MVATWLQILTLILILTSQRTERPSDVSGWCVLAHGNLLYVRGGGAYGRPETSSRAFERDAKKREQRISNGIPILDSFSAVEF